MQRTSALGAYLELARVSNLPTVWSNVLVGIAIGVLALQQSPAAPVAGSALLPFVPPDSTTIGVTFPWHIAALVAVGISLFYVAGMALNDVLDVEVDRLERPGRPIPSGRVSRQSASVFVIAMLALGLAIIASVNLRALLPAGLLGLLIILYDFLHRHSVLMVLVMGACRALVYLTAAMAITWPLGIPQAWAFPLILAGYIVAVSLLARSEAGSPGRVRLVLTMLAGISLLDAALLLSMGCFWPAGLAVSCFFLTMAGHRRIMGT